MQFILLIFINIIMGAVFYLILRLKLEKYASDYREKRLKREMDEIICEFNETAERNITLLENRIDYLKKLLEKSSAVNKIDIKIDNNINDIGNVNFNERIYRNNLNTNNEILNKQIDKSRQKKNNYFNEFYSNVKIKLNNAIKSVSDLYNKNNYSSKNPENDSIGNRQNVINTSGETKETIEINISDKDKISIYQSKDQDELPENKLKEMFKTAEDKYSLISELYSKGYSTDSICRSSGIPIGEIKLVLDLNNSL